MIALFVGLRPTFAELMQNLSNLTVREIAIEAPATTRVFEKYKIDYCCGGRRSIKDACAASGVDADELSKALEQALALPAEPEQPEQMSIPQLIDHIIDTHHVFTRRELFRLSGLVDKVSSKHGERHPELFKLKNLFTALSDDLLLHLKKEEAALFPYVQELARAKERSTLPMIAPFGSVEHPVGMMETEHEDAGSILTQMRQVTNDYQVPEGACPSYTALYFGLEELEKDLHRHIHLENNILFPRAVELEAAVFAV